MVYMEKMNEVNHELLALTTLINYKKSLMNMIVSMEEDNNSEEEEELCHKIKLAYDTSTPHRIESYIVNVVNNYDDIQFQQNFRLKRVAFERLLEILTPKFNTTNVAGGRPQREVKQQLLAVIWLLATPDSYRSVAERFNMSKSLLSNCFVRVVNALNLEIAKFIKWPTGSELQIAKAKFGISSVFKNLIGVVDGTYVALSVSKTGARAYTNRKCFTSMTLQAICDVDMRYIDVYCGWLSSVPDIRIFKNSHIYQGSNDNVAAFFPNGEYILGDKAYPLLDWCITPYMNRGRISAAEVRFNTKHSSCRQVVERSFALLFGRFRRLKNLDMHRIDWAATTITACCILHNICLDFDGDVVGDYITEGQPIQHRNNTNEVHQHSNRTRDSSTSNAITKRNSISVQINY